LVHPYIVPINQHYIGDDGYHIVVSKWAGDGLTLEQMLVDRRKDRNPLSEREVMQYFTMVVIALEQTH
jgi:hypothetical protein